MLDRRRFLATAAAALFAPSVAIADNVNEIREFYLDITRKSYDDIFASDFAEVKNADDLFTLLSNKSEAYKNALIRHGGEYLANAAAGDQLEELRKEIGAVRRQWNGFLQPLKDDIRAYAHRNGKYYREDEPKDRSGTERTNPLFLAIHDLALAGKIQPGTARATIENMVDLIYPQATQDSFLEVLASRPAPRRAAERVYKPK